MKPTTLGLIGGGQIGKMIAQEAKRMSVEVVVLDPTPDCPAAQVGGRQIVADFKDIEAIRRLGKQVDAVTYEIELGNTDALKELEAEGVKILPAPETLRIIQDKFLQKQHLQKAGVPVPEFLEVESREQLAAAAERFGFPTVLKSRRDAYDGRGNFTLRSLQDISDLLNAHQLNGNLGEKKFMLEKFVPFVKEISVMVARNAQGQCVCFPLVENVHDQHILFMTIAPAMVPSEIAQRAKRVALQAIESLKGVGMFGVEMFLCKDDQILVNEIAPRPHNSGHYTIEACDHSQFEMHIRSVLNLPLVEPKLLSPAVMLNILGQTDSEENYSVENVQGLFSIPGAKLHLYGKKGMRLRRKLGHVTVLDETVEGALFKADQVRKILKIQRNDAQKN